jgi:hypothetical protein
VNPVPGGSVEIDSAHPVDFVSVVARDGADVLRTSARYDEGRYHVSLHLSEQVAVYEVWTCPDDSTDPSAAPEDAGTGARPEPNLASDAAAAALRARFPTTIGSLPVDIATLTAEEWLSADETAMPAAEAAARESLRSLASAADVSIDEIAIVSGLVEVGPGQHAVVAAVSLPGVDAESVVDEVVGFMLPDVAAPRVVAETLGGKPVLRVSDATTPGAYPRALYVEGDTIWLIEADEPLRAQIAEALPGPGS